MSKVRAQLSIEEMEQLIKVGAKKYVRYEEGAKLYSIGRNSFIDLAKEAEAIYKIKGCAVVNIQKVDRFIEENLQETGW